MSVNREALLRAAEQFSSASDSDEESDDSIKNRSLSKKRQKRDKKEKAQKHSSKKHGKKYKRHKRTEQEKIMDFERRAAAIGAISIIPRLPSSLSSLATAAGGTGDAAVLDTSGDPNNTMFESLYAGSVPRYNRLDPMNLVSSKARLTWHAQLSLPDADAGNSRADRYYKGRHMMAERSRKAKRIHLADLRPKQHQAAQLPPASGAAAAGSSYGSALLQPSMNLLQPSALPASATAAGTTGAPPAGAPPCRKLNIPAPAFIPLQPPEDLVTAAAAAAAGEAGARSAAAAGTAGWAAADRAGGSSSAKLLEPQALVEQAGLSAEELVLNATRQWNVAVRERPQDEQLWLDLAAFQHTAAKLLQQRGRSDAADAATAEKQVAVLTRGLTHHPQSSVLLLALLRSYAIIAPDAAALEDKWKGVLARQRGDWTLWREYLAQKQGSFASFSITAVQQSHQQALHALYMELLATRRKAAVAYKQQHGDLTPQQLAQLSPAAAAAAAAASGSGSTTATAAAAVAPLSAAEEGLELQLVQLLLGLMHTELLAGHCEQAVGKIQALLEYHLFQPPTPPGGASALLRLFAAYWKSGSARIGEAGARGWAYWCCWNAMGLQPPTAAQQQEQQREQEPEAEEPAGWSGWFEVPQQQQYQQQQQQQQQQEDAQQQVPPKPKRKHTKRGSDLSGSSVETSHTPDSPERSEGELPAEQGSEVHSEEEQEDELDEVELMLQLGVQLEEQLQAVEQQGMPGHILKEWVKQEALRSSSQWQPLHPNALEQQQQQQQADHAACPDPARLVDFDAIEPCLFPVRSLQALRRLVLGCVELLGAPVGLWCSSNCPTPLQQVSLAVPGVHLGSQVTPAGGSVTVAGAISNAKQWSDASVDDAGAETTAAVTQVAGPGVTPGVTSSPALISHQPWHQAGADRWTMLVSLLERLVAGGPCSNWHELCQALLLLHASKPLEAEAAAGKPSDSRPTSVVAAAAAAAGEDPDTQERSLLALTLDGGAAAAPSSTTDGCSSRWTSAQQLAAVRAAAKRLLSEQQDNLLLYDAYGCCEAAMGQNKTARKVLEAALILASSTARGGSGSGSSSSTVQSEAAAAAAAVPLLALHLAQLELSALESSGALERAHAALHACLALEPYSPPAAASKGAAAAAAGMDAGTFSHQPPQQQQQQQQQQGLLADQALAKARHGFQDRVPQLLASGAGALTPSAAAIIAAAALFELTVGMRAGRAGRGLQSAAAVYKQVLAAVPEAVRAASPQHEQLQGLYCHMLVAAATGAVQQLVPALSGRAAAAASGGSAGSTAGAAATAVVAAVTPARARSALAAALQLYPHSKTLLNLQVELDHACYTLAGLRRQLAAMSEQNPSPGLWGVALQAESFRPGGRMRLRAMFERAVAAPSPLQWHQQQKRQRQRQQQAWAAAVAEQPQQSSSQPSKPKQQEEQRQQRLLQGASAASSAAVLLDLAVQDGYRGWGNCGEVWLSYMQYELGLGRPEAARKLFLRALHECPGFKALWLCGFGALYDSLQPRESSGLLNAMQEREVVVRADVYEVLLADMAAQQA